MTPNPPQGLPPDDRPPANLPPLPPRGGTGRPGAPGDTPGEPARYPIVLAVFAAVTFFALVVCAFGFISLFADLEVIDERDAGPLVGPAMVAVALAVVLISLLRRAAHLRALPEDDPERSRIPAAGIALTAVAAYLAYALSGAVLYAFTTASILAGVIFARDTFLGPFAVAVAVAALVVATLYAVLVVVGGEHPRRPLWPWERDRE